MSITGTAETVAGAPATREGWSTRVALPGALLALAAVGWWWSVEVDDDMSAMSSAEPVDGAMGADGMGMDAGGMAMGAMDAGTTSMVDPMSLGAFVVAWVAMMAAMMLPAILPVVKLYARAATRGRVAPIPFFVSGYLALWTVLALPAYLAWRELEMPLADGRDWAGRVAGLTLLAAALWQISPLKAVCLRHCRSPMGFFMRYGDSVRTPVGALRTGVVHGAFCIGCCWALFVVIVAAASMSLWWLVGFTALIILEKNWRYGERVALAVAPALAGLGIALLITPSFITTIA